MLNFIQMILIEEEQIYKGGFEEEGYQIFDCQWCIEDIFYIVGIVRLVSFELEFYGQIGSYIQSEVDIK